MQKLNAAQVKSISEPGLHAVGDTLYIRVAAGGSKSWIQRLTVQRRRRDIGLGGFPATSLSEAREKAHENRKLARAGGDPISKRKKGRMPTFREAAQKTWEGLKPTWRNRKHAVSWLQTLERHAFPILGDLQVDLIDRDDVLNVLKPIWSERTETARRVRQRIRTVLEWCQDYNFVDGNVASSRFRVALPPMPKYRKHLRALHHENVAEALRKVDDSSASMSARFCLQFLVLTTVRSGEARGATWEEIDKERKVWSIPSTRMKSSPDGHRVPLSEPALEILDRARELQDESGLVFPSPVRLGRPLSDMTLMKVLRDRGLADRTTVHGFRSSFRDWAAENGCPREVAEAALAHKVQGVEGSYLRSDLLEQRRQLMNTWAAYITSSTKRGDSNWKKQKK